MFRTFPLLLLLGRTTVALAQSPVTAILGATLWDGTGSPVLPNSVVLVRDSVVICAGTRLRCPVPSNSKETVDARGRWLIPGLIDSHVHLLFLEARDSDPELIPDLRHLIAQGITAVRDMGTDPARLLAMTRELPARPHIFTMQLVAGFKFFYGRDEVRDSAGIINRRVPPAVSMRELGWTPLPFLAGDDPDSIVVRARKAGAIGLKLYADLNTAQVAALCRAAHAAGMPVWGHAWVQPSSALEQALAGQDGVVHAAGLVGELFPAAIRDSMRGATALLLGTADSATPASARDPRVLAALDSFVKRGTMFEPTLDVTLKSAARYRHSGRQGNTLPGRYVKAAQGFGVQVTREAYQRGVLISAGTDHAAYGPEQDRASLLEELELLVDSVGMKPSEALLTATRNAARAIGTAAAHLGTIAPGQSADLVLLTANPLSDISNIRQIEWVMVAGEILKDH